VAKILVAEDDRRVRELLVDTLFDAGYDVVEAKNGKAALERAFQEHPDLVLLDIWMPFVDGFEVLVKLREEPATKSVPVILLTALPAIQGEQDGMNLGVLHYITKPWAPGLVEATVRIALRESRPGST
jgi:DNA-binding response OmpR family regulator